MIYFEVWAICGQVLVTGASIDLINNFFLYFINCKVLFAGKIRFTFFPTCKVILFFPAINGPPFTSRKKSKSHFQGKQHFAVK